VAHRRLILLGDKIPLKYLTRLDTAARIAPLSCGQATSLPGGFLSRSLESGAF